MVKRPTGNARCCCFGGFATFQEDPVGLSLAEERGLVGNFMWANDYPHHEGSWPHSAAAIERQMGDLSDASRARILGLNAAEVFRFPIPERYLGHEDARTAQAQGQAHAQREASTEGRRS